MTIKDIQPWHLILIMIIVALPTAIEHDHYVALLIWGLVFNSSFGDR